MSLEVSGHAGFAPAGRDIVCAAASILAYTAGELALDMERRGQLLGPPAVKMQPGEAVVRLTPRNRPRAEIGLETIGCGFALLAKKYPRCIRVTER